MTNAQKRIVELVKAGYTRLNLEDRQMLCNGFGKTEYVRYPSIAACLRKGLIRFNYDSRRYEAN